MSDWKKYTAAQRDMLEAIDWAETNFGSLLTGRHNRRSTMLTLIKHGLAESIGLVHVADGDGFILDTHQCREGFRMTPKGRAILEAVRNRSRLKPPAGEGE